jgi:hypothetical protein
LITVGLREILLDGVVDPGSSTDDVLDRGAALPKGSQTQGSPKW